MNRRELLKRGGLAAAGLGLVKDGFVQVPDGPGLGIELNEKAVKDALRRRGRENDYFPPTDPWNSERSIDRPWS